jgi:hypothetical protein
MVIELFDRGQFPFDYGCLLIDGFNKPHDCDLMTIDYSIHLFDQLIPMFDSSYLF